jgi:hypothetical protein
MGKHDLFGGVLENSMVIGAQAALDAQDESAEHLERLAEREYDTLVREVRDAILAGDSAAVVPHVSAAGKRIHAMLIEITTDHMHDQDGALLRLLSCAALGDPAGAAEAAETIISTVSHRHAEDVCERLDLAGEVMA